ncbi:MAG: hypothetical protein K2X55_26630 [Burkholderiaceae bacterium]|nr:hypothetical protein [Burkholderiaceae bacterium]
MAQIAIISNQRSGTNHLRSILSKTLNVLDLDEALVLSSHAKPTGLYWYMKESRTRWPSPTKYFSCDLFFKNYLNWIKNNHADNFIIDLKYNVIHTGLPATFTLCEPPPVLRALADIDTIFIHIIRNNSIDVVLSSMLAEQSGVYHSFRNEKSKIKRSEKLVLDVDNSITRISAHQITVGIFKHIGKSLPNLVSIDYDKLNSQNISEVLMPLKLKIEDEWKIEISSWVESDLVKAAVPWWERISNLDEFCSKIKEDGRFSHFLPAHLV